MAVTVSEPCDVIRVGQIVVVPREENLTALKKFVFALVCFGNDKIPLV